MKQMEATAVLDAKPRQGRNQTAIAEACRPQIPPVLSSKWRWFDPDGGAILGAAIRPASPSADG